MIYMAVVPICYKIFYRDQSLPIRHGGERGFICDSNSMEDGSCLSSNWSDRGRRCHISYPATSIILKAKTRGVNASGGMVTETPVTHTTCSTESHLRSISENVSPGENLCTLWYASESGTNDRQLRSLDSYFGKLRNEANRHSSNSSNKLTELPDRSGQFKLKKGLGSLEDYLGKLNKEANSESYAPSIFDEETTEGKPVAGPFSISEDSRRGDEQKLRYFTKFRERAGGRGSKSLQVPQSYDSYDETSDLYFISILASINIAVFLFEIASPIRNSNLDLFSLPLIYGAKINDLILIGEWWRLVTPMFLHSGPFHIAFGFWAILTFGPQVCKGYGSFTFLLIYILGGISGNLISFLHTPGPTVGGTGPVFAVIGAWLIYQIQNKDVIAKNLSESMLQKAIVATALSCIISNFGPIDDWAHFGAAFTGIVYGLFTCPTLQLDDASSKTGQKEGITLVRRYADPCKSLIVFSTFILVFGSLLFFVQPPLNTPEINELL